MKETEEKKKQKKKEEAEKKENKKQESKKKDKEAEKKETKKQEDKKIKKETKKKENKSKEIKEEKQKTTSKNKPKKETKTKSDKKEKIEKIWSHFFTPGDITKYEADGQRSIYYLTDNDKAYIMDTGNNDVRTEGMSYGMMISVQLDKRNEFDKLWKWSKDHMAYSDDSPWSGYFCWQCAPDGTKIGTSNASDGELYYVTSLFLAGKRWNEPRYIDEANDILRKIMTKDGKTTGVYDLFDRDHNLITFVPDNVGHRFTDPSYQLPAFLDYWAVTAATDREFWKEAANAARNHLIESAHPVTGLHPDYSNYDGSPYRWPHAGYDTSVYMYDAIRCAMNIGMDYYLTGKDKSRQSDVMKRMLAFFKNDGFTHGHFPVDGSKPFGAWMAQMP